MVQNFKICNKKFDQITSFNSTVNYNVIASVYLPFNFYCFYKIDPLTKKQNQHGEPRNLELIL